MDIIITGLLLGGTYALIAFGLNLQYGVARIMNLANGEFLVLGALAAVPGKWPGAALICRRSILMAPPIKLARFCHAGFPQPAKTACAARSLTLRGQRDPGQSQQPAAGV